MACSLSSELREDRELFGYDGNGSGGGGSGSGEAAFSYPDIEDLRLSDTYTIPDSPKTTVTIASDTEFEQLWEDVKATLPPTIAVDMPFIGEVKSVYYNIYDSIPKQHTPKLRVFLNVLYSWAQKKEKTNPEWLHYKHERLERILEIKKRKMSRRFHYLPRKQHLRSYYMLYMKAERTEPCLLLNRILISTPMRSIYGITCYTSLVSPYPSYRDDDGSVVVTKFTCGENCKFCPKETVIIERDGKIVQKKVMPRSYLTKEPACLRAYHNKFCAVRQTYDRGNSYMLNGHPVDKGEFKVLGGTWSHVHRKYQRRYIRDLYYACNTFPYGTTREPLSLAEEQRINETADFRMIGLTLETRPDCVPNPTELKLLREYGCTRLQMGVQTIHNDLLKKIDRGHTLEDSIDGIKAWRDIGGKNIIHMMPDLPGTTPERDIEMWDYMIDTPNLQPDELKVYPTETVPWTEIYEMYKRGEYMPYAEQNMDLLINVILHLKRHSIDIPWCRFTRIIRDIPNNYIKAGNSVTNLRQILMKLLKKEGKMCWCTRCRAVKEDIEGRGVAKMDVQTYRANEGTEYFISYVSPDKKKLYGFCRLRITDRMHKASKKALPILIKKGLVRELHVYGQTLKVKSIDTDRQSSQHYGFGKRLLKKAEEISLKNNCYGVAIISGIGVRPYYRRMNYKLIDGYMVKMFTRFQHLIVSRKVQIMILCSIVVLIIAFILKLL